MGRELSLREIKKIALSNLLHFKQFCKKENITFYLSNGTLLGSVKYGGFIPWDDDIDVLVPREDYDKLIELYEDSNEYWLFSPERSPDYKFSFAKLCNTHTIKEEENINNGVQLGIDIDIFPLDSCSSRIFTTKVQCKMKLFQKGCILSKVVSVKDKPLHKKVVIYLCKMLKFNFFYTRLVKLVSQEQSREKTYKGCLMWPIYGEKEIIPAEVFSDTVEVEFEGEKFPAPIGYDIYLRSLYGDYEQDPPIEKQKSHHQFVAYKMV